MDNVRQHLGLLGLKVEDKVTGLIGIVDSISFDLYGCVQAGVNPGLDKDDKQRNCSWFDVARLNIKNKKPVMDTRNFDFGDVAVGKRGPADKPPMHSV